MTTPTIVEAWNGPGRRDGELTAVRPQHNALHSANRFTAFEHWYFDAHLTSGHTVIGFLAKRRPEDLPNCRPWVELIVYAPDRTRMQVSKKYPRAQATFSTEECNVVIGPNRAHVEWSESGLPIHHVFLAEDGLEFDLKFENETPSWMPGKGETHFGAKNSFGWTVGAPRARVSGTVRIGGERFDAEGRGYADHNWGVGDMKRVIERWHWGRLYVDEYSLLYATVLTQKKFGAHEIRPLMLARGDEIILSTGEVEFTEGPAVYEPTANRSYPAWIRVHVPGAVDLRLTVNDVIHAHDFVDDVPVLRTPLLRPLAYRLVGHPGYFRFNSSFELSVTTDKGEIQRTGTTLHELVALR